ncbi:OmpA family protein [Nitrospira sp. Nam80]
MTRVFASALMLCLLITSACVSHDTHSRALGELNEARHATLQSRHELDAYKKEAAAVAEANDAERSRLSQQLRDAHMELASLRSELGDLQRELEGKTATLGEANSRVRALSQVNNEAAGRLGSMEFEKQAAQGRISTMEKEAEAMRERLASLEKERDDLTVALRDTQDRERELQAQVASLASQVGSLQNENHSLLSGTTTAKDVIAQLQKRAGELESVSARADDLARQLNEREQDLARQRQIAADQGQELTALRAAAAEKENLATQLAAVTKEMAELGQERDQLKESRAHLANEQERLQAKLQQEMDRVKTGEIEKDGLAQQLASLTGDMTKLAAERDQLKDRQAQLAGEQEKLLARLQQEADRLRAEEAEKNRLEKERLAKEEEIQRLTKAQADLTHSLQDEINKGTITIQQVRDRLTINMVEKVLFDSGQAQIKPEGLKVLKQVSDVLKDVADKQIRIEGHTDNVPIGTKLRDKFATNWELSTARATSVVRYLVEDGGVGRELISAAGYADTRPVAANDSEDGKASNRRIEIVLYPKDLANIANELRADAREEAPR